MLSIPQLNRKNADFVNDVLQTGANRTEAMHIALALSIISNLELPGDPKLRAEDYYKQVLRPYALIGVGLYSELFSLDFDKLDILLEGVYQWRAAIAKGDIMKMILSGGSKHMGLDAYLTPEQRDAVCDPKLPTYMMGIQSIKTQNEEMETMTNSRAENDYVEKA